MPKSKVEFTINIGGNALKGVAKLSKEVEGLGTASEKANSKLSRTISFVGKWGMQLAGIIESVRAISAKMQEYTDAYNAQIEAEAKLAQVMRNTMGAREGEIQSIKDLAAAQQRLGVIGDEVQLAGAQELGTYLTKTETLKRLMPVMNDMLAQQYGLNASQEQAVQIASMLGKVMDGQVGALSRYGYRFDKAQEKILKTGNEEQRAAMLAKVVGDAVGGMNKRLALTNAGRAKQLANNMGDIKEQVGALSSRLKNSLIPAASAILSKIQAIVSVPLPQQIASEKAELNLLVESLINASDKEDERKRLIDEIQAKYPDFLKNLDAEKATTEELRDALAQTNQEYDKRMRKAALERRLAEYDEASQSAMGDIVKYQMAIEAKEQRKKLLQQRNALLAEYGKQYVYSEDSKKIMRFENKMLLSLKKGELSQDQIDAVQNLVDQYNAYGENLTFWGFNDDKKLAKAQEEYEHYQRGRAIVIKKIDEEFGNDSDNQGIAEVRLPGESRTTPSLGTAADTKVSRAADTTVTGGTRNTQITINLGKMVENINFIGSLQDNADQLQAQVEEALLRTLYAAQSAAV